MKKLKVEDEEEEKNPQGRVGAHHKTLKTLLRDSFEVLCLEKLLFTFC